MRTLSTFLPLMTLAALGAESGDFVENLNLVGKITKALVESKNDRLTPRLTRDREMLYSYHLKTVSNLAP